MIQSYLQEECADMAVLRFACYLEEILLISYNILTICSICSSLKECRTSIPTSLSKPSLCPEII